MTAEEEDRLIGHDLSRLPPRIFRETPAAMIALRKEIDGLVRPDAAGHPGLLEVGLMDPKYKTTPRVFTTIVMKSPADYLKQDWYCVGIWFL